MPLTDVLIKTAKPGPKPVRLFDGGGLYLEVAPSGGKWWRLKYRHDGKEKRLSLGTYPDTSLKDARERRDLARRDLAAGIDPGAKRKAEKATRTALAANTFEAVAREWHQAVHCAAVTDGHAARTLLRLEQDAFPWIGATPIAEVTAPKLLEALRKVEARGAIETAHRVRQACGQVFRYGIATGRCERDPAADLRDALQPVIVKHHAAITDPRKVGELLRAFDDYQGLPTTRAALKLAPLVFLRPGELRQAEWAEFDLDAAVWTVPAARMKRTKQQKASGAPHLVPLSRQAVAVLRELEPLTGRGRYVFPSPRGGSRPMSDNAVLSALRRMGFAKDEMSGHGFRAMARTLMAERLGVPESVVEAQLAHAVRDSLGRAYNRTEFVDQRRSMMQQWADYLDTLRQGAQVLPFKTA
ncbi:integrase arm-type DNA-binding domain-containing protein [Aquabacterium fontiphilum]|uniref:tyrosine-type recombinase/integrase n=1 Tax=Aquabacterium fontiphilum TaxID=450365 RepID=UPI001376BA60|nr:integrase arm-type DNA-binding domain-containing protein [Aquabacterium fontiphilum]NBD19525.1 integrase arm-type DNA-binding domain-containing protein [Aquabacterium fontiphilum]